MVVDIFGARNIISYAIYVIFGNCIIVIYVIEGDDDIIIVKVLQMRILISFCYFKTFILEVFFIIFSELNSYAEIVVECLNFLSHFITHFKVFIASFFNFN